MRQGQSNECADAESTDNLSMEKEIKNLRQIAQKEGLMAMSKYIKMTLNRWQTEQIKIAITGLGATGKSTFINTIRNVKPRDDGFAKAGSGDTTITPTLYIHPTNDQITYCDLPGYSSTMFKKEDYISEMKISDYDFFLIFVNNVLSEDEVWMAGELRKLDKPFTFVRSKIDVDIDNAIYDGKDPEMIIPEIKRQLKEALDAKLEYTNCMFLISSRKPDLGEMSDLIRYIEETMDGFKAQVLLFSIHPMTRNIVERKHKMLKARLVKVTALAASIAATPVPGVDVVANFALLAKEVGHYMHVFEVQQEFVNSLKDFDQSLLKCRSLLTPTFKMIPFIIVKLGTYATVLIAQSWLDLILPFFGSVISAATASWGTYTFLDDMLQDLKHDAMLIHGHHVMEASVDHRSS
jgi:GTP-binding protein EngB required for normal cell division